MEFNRPESSVSVLRDEYGELVFAAERHGAVIRRTPEELGLPRTVPDEPPGKLMPWIDRAAVLQVRRAREARAVGDPQSYPVRCTACGAAVGMPCRGHYGAALARPHRERLAARPAAKLRTVRGVSVLMPPEAVMGAEMLEGFAAQAAESEEKRMPVGGFDMDGEIARKIVAADCAVPARVLAAELGVPESRVYGVRSQAFREGRLTQRSASEAAKAAHAAKGDHAAKRRKPVRVQALAAAETAAVLQPAGDGMAAALAGAVTVRLELTPEELARLLDKMSVEQKTAFVGAGLRAALLA